MAVKDAAAAMAAVVVAAEVNVEAGALVVMVAAEGVPKPAVAPAGVKAVVAAPSKAGVAPAPMAGAVAPKSEVAVVATPEVAAATAEAASAVMVVRAGKRAAPASEVAMLPTFAPGSAIAKADIPGRELTWKAAGAGLAGVAATSTVPSLT
jgi:hypothetical protein